MTGASGLIGRALVASLASGGVETVALRRGAGEDPRWDPERGALDPGVLAGCEAVVHLAGESIAGRFTARRRARIRASRVNGTQLLAATLASLTPPPRVLVSASAIGCYGDRGEETLDESSPPGEGFLAEVAREWEAATAPAEAAGIRVVHLRNGLVLSPEGGALAPLVRLARLGLGGPLGSGRQWWSWIALADVIGLIRHALADAGVSGPLNATAPAPVRQAEFARVLGRVLRRPAMLPAPAFALRLVLGRGMADALLLASARVLPRRALDGGFRFTHPDLEETLRSLRSAPGRA